MLYIYINRHAGTPNKNKDRRHDKLGLQLNCYITSRIGWVSMEETYKEYRCRVILGNCPITIVIRI